MSPEKEAIIKDLTRLEMVARVAYDMHGIRNTSGLDQDQLLELRMEYNIALGNWLAAKSLLDEAIKP